MRMRWNSDLLRRLIQVSRGERPSDLCLRGGRLVNVLSGQIETADLAVQDGWIVGWGEYEARREIDLNGMYLAPGFIDGHIHLESSMLGPEQFCAAVLPRGTSAVVADPHEMANVLGLDGIRYFLEAAEKLPLDIFLNLPSCVPASPLETSGAQLRASDLYALMSHPRVLGLAEMMNFPGVIGAFPEVLDKLLLFQEKTLDGHAPQLTGRDLNAYLVSGIGSDHECTTLPEAREKLAKGMTLMIREGSQSKDLAPLLPVVNDHTWPRCMLVSDDRHPDDLLREGHMNAIVNRATALGMDPVRALTLATWTPARYFGLSRMGALAPGYQADFSVSPTLSPWVPERVFKKGIEVAREGKLLIDSASWPRTSPPPSPMNLSRLNIEDLSVPAQPGRIRIIGVQEGTLLTRKILLPPKVVDGLVVPDPDRDILKLAVYNRYSSKENPPAVGFVQGFGLRKGAIASTVAHDSHNLLVAGTSDAAILRVAEAVRRAGGGMAIGDEEGNTDILPLPIGGLMSDRSVGEVAEHLERLKQQAKAWGSLLRNPFMALSFLALPVIPELKLTDLGLVDVSAFSFVSLFEAE